MSERREGEVIEGLRGAYVVRRRRGEGSFGVTYEATARASGERVMVKELKFARLGEWKSLELFEREGRVLERLSHPGIPAYRDFFAHDGARAFPASELDSYTGEGALTILLVQAFVEGENLDERTRRGGALDGAAIPRVLRSLLETLAYLHAQSPPVVHRDIHPKNVILGPGGAPSLVDFGSIQERLRSASEVGSTTVGTLGFMPLEQARGDARPASDLYALGVTMLVACSGKPPNEMPVDEATGKLRVGELAPGVSPGVRRTLDAMVEPIVGRRVASAREALVLLDAPQPRPALRRLLPLIAAAGTAAIAAGAIAVLARRPDAASPPSAVTVLAWPLLDPPATPAPSGPPRPAPPPVPDAPKPPPLLAVLAWSASVASSSGAALAVGAPCSVEARATSDGERATVGALVVSCAGQRLYDSEVRLEGMSQTETGIEEVPVAGKPGVFAYHLVYSDVGTRTGARAQATIDSQKKTAIVFHDTVPVYRVTLALRPLSEPRSGEPLLARTRGAFDHVVDRRMRVVGAEGPAPVPSGAACKLRLSPSYGERSCRVELTCGATRLFGGGDAGYEDCPVTGGEPQGFVDAEPSSVDHDPRAELDLARGTMTVSDDLPGGTYTVRLTTLP